ncbi:MULTISPECIES: right-handed parallel beta-helix repeat-containing protein [unclassified Sphingomonas]|uniref:right-handed parallel beta-helix repeat-containing protein n=1 Tax=unclassified Sphingomonas TaxID=196159 RepID=UPI001056C5B8|nr:MULTISPECIES: right-handed parallel beta-helix repeat-containing protein [unclassified Sphingomonas]
MGDSAIGPTTGAPHLMNARPNLANVAALFFVSKVGNGYMMIHRRVLLRGALLAPCASRAFAAQNRVFTPEEFGAKGDGVTNDSAAMARLSTAVRLYGGGTVEFRRTTYVVGAQGLQVQGAFAFPPRELLTFVGCSLPLHLKGNGARLLCEPGLRFGVFRDGEPFKHAMPYLGPGVASPYNSMILVEGCTAAVRISDLDLEGPGDRIMVGGQYGDTGWQILSTGLILRNNAGSEIVERVHTHSHCQDGMMIDGVDADTPGVERSLVRVTADSNGRQGCSIVGGRGYRFTGCSFTRSARGSIKSAPGAGVDIEAEGKKHVRDLAFSKCLFSDNGGCGMVADSGDTERVRFENCTFIGTVNWSAWPSKPFFKFEDCTFVGAMTRAFGDSTVARATTFARCTFDDDPARSPTREVFGGGDATAPMVNLGNNQNVSFDKCRFSALHGSVLPWSTGAIYRDCIMAQGNRAFGYPRGQFVGTNRITGKVDLYNSKISGVLTVNGRLIPPSL